MSQNRKIADFISSRMTDYKNSKITSLFIRISFYSVALSMMVMIFSSFLISGFQAELDHRMAILYGDLVISESSDLQNEFSQKTAFAFDSDTLAMLQSEKSLRSAEPYLIDFTMLKKGETPSGVVVKGFSFGEDAAEHEFITEGTLPTRLEGDSLRYEIALSRNIAKRLQAKIGDELIAYFSSDAENIKIKKLIITGIYNSSVYEHDDAMIWADISLIQDIRSIPPDYYHAISLMLRDADDYTEVREDLWNRYLRNPLQIESISDRFGYITDWIELQKTNEYIILIIMFVIALINMISCILILILDRLPMIGSLKAIGTSDATLQQVFLNLSRKIILRGILWGNIVALVLAYLQYRFHIIKLPEEYYLIGYVPIAFDWSRFLLINVSFFILLSIALIIPTMIIRRLKPVQILKYK